MAVRSAVHLRPLRPARHGEAGREGGSADRVVGRAISMLRQLTWCNSRSTHGKLPAGCARHASGEQLCAPDSNSITAPHLTAAHPDGPGPRE